MININGKNWADITENDIKAVVSSPENDESFFFEFKDDRVGNNKLVKELSAFANTFGGYIFLGISDSKQIEGCTEWNEQRIHTVIHDSITPVPSFDIKKIVCNGLSVYVIRVDEGPEPPYITNEGKIYERLSSGSFPIKDSVRLSQIYNKREQQLLKMEKAITIDPIATIANNIYGYIDIGFFLILSNFDNAKQIFDATNLKSIISTDFEPLTPFNLSYVGSSICYTLGKILINNEDEAAPAHMHNYLEIMPNGSARMRILLSNNEPKNVSVNMIYASAYIAKYKELYTKIMGELFPFSFIYAKKYEALTVIRQFQPVAFFDDFILEQHPELMNIHQRYISNTQSNRIVCGVDSVVTNNRIPKVGLYTIDKQMIQNNGQEYTKESIIEELFHSSYLKMGFPID